MEGWVKLHRKIKENPIYTNSKAVHIWIECLLRANHKGKIFFLQRQKIFLQPGQFVMGRSEFAKDVNLSASTVWFWLNQFKVDSMIDINSSPKGTVITVLKWNDYQKVDSEVDNKKTTKKQQKDINKNDKNDKNNNKERKQKFDIVWLEGFIERNNPDEARELFGKSLKPDFVFETARKIVPYMEKHHKRYTNFKQTLSNWIARAVRRQNEQIALDYPGKTILSAEEL